MTVVTNNFILINIVLPLLSLVFLFVMARHDPGVEVEYEVFVPAYFALVLNNNPIVEDFTIRNNVEEFGNMDVVVEIKLTDNRELKFAFQLEHRENKDNKVLPSSSTARGNFQIRKYCEAFKKLKQENQQYHVIFYTNAKVDPKRTKEVTSFKMTGDDRCEGKTFFNTSYNLQNIYKFDVNDKTEDGDVVTKSDYQQFLSRFTLFTSQNNSENFENEIFGILGNKKAGLSYINLFQKWHQGKFTNNKLDKATLNIQLIHILLSPHILTNRHISTSQGKGFEVFKSVVRKFDVTVFDDSSGNIIEEFVESEKLNDLEELPEHIKKQLEFYMTQYNMDMQELIDSPDQAMTKCLLRLGREFKILEKLQKELQHDEKTKLYSYFFARLLIINFNENSQNLIRVTTELYRIKDNRIKLVLFGKNINTTKFAKLKIFKNLTDLQKIDNEHYIEIIKGFKVSVQGRNSISLQTFINFYEVINKLISAKELLQILKGDYQIGEDREILPSTYIPRMVSTICLDLPSVLEHFLKNYERDLLVVIYEEQLRWTEDLIKRKKLNVIDINRYLQQWTDNRSEEQLKHLVRIRKYEERTNIDFHQVCKKNKNRNVHLLKFLDRTHCMLVMSTNNTLKHFKSQKLCLSEETILSYSTSPVNGVCAQPGMGKSTLLKYLRNTCSDYWTVGVDLKLHNSYFREKHHGYEVLRYLLKLRGEESDPFLNKIKKAFLRRKKVALFFDGLDEIETRSADNVLDCISYLAAEGYYVWVASRPNLLKTLEDNLNVFTIKIEELSERQQEQYIRNSLKAEYQKNEIDVIVSKISHNPDVTNSRGVLGIPLQLSMITQIFLNDRKHFENSKENMFVLTKMYKLYFEGKYNDFIRRRRLEIQDLTLSTLETRLKSYHIPALQSCLSDESFKKLNLDLQETHEFLDTIKETGDPLGIIVRLTTEQKALFEHTTFAEYFASVYLSKNFDKIRMLRDDLFSGRYENLMLILNIILAEDCELHLAVIYKNTDEIEKHLKDARNLNVHDNGGRNPLHLACCNATRHPRLKSSLSGGRYVIDDSHLQSFEGETSTNKEILKKLITSFDLLEEDQLFGWNALAYSLASECLFVSEAILEKNSRIDLSAVKKFYHDTTIAYYSSRCSYTNLLNSVIKRKRFFNNVSVGHITKMTNRAANSLLHLVLIHNTRKNITSVSAQNEDDDFRTIKLLLRYGVSVHVKDKDQLTAMDWAVATQQSETLTNLLYKKGGRVTITTKASELFKAAQNNNTKAINLLLKQGVDVNLKYFNGTALYAALTNGHFESVKLLIENGARVDFTYNGSKSTVLHWASKSGNTDIINLLLKNYRHINVREGNSNTPLHVAVANECFDAARMLIHKGADVNLFNKNNNTILHLVAKTGNTQFINFLLNKNVDVNARNIYGKTALQIAFTNNHLDVVELLIENGADAGNFNITHDNKNTLLHWAARRGNTQVIDFLLNKGFDINAKNKDGDTALHKAIIHESDDAVSLLIERGADFKIINNDQQSVLHSASTSGDIQIINLLLELGLDINARNKDGNTPLHVAAINGHFKAVKLLIAKGAPVNVINEQNDTVLHSAARKGDIRIINFLLTHNLDINAKNKHENTVLQMAFINESFNAIKFLIRNSADFNITDHKKNTLLHWAAIRGNVQIMNLLLTRDIDINAKNKDGETALHKSVNHQHYDAVELLLERGADCNVINDDDKGNILHCAASRGNVKIVRLLLKMGPDINAKNKDGNTALHMAAINGHFDAVKLLIENGAYVSIHNDNDDTVLHWTAVVGNVQIMNLLLKNGIDINAKNKDGNTALDIADKNGQYYAQQLLIKKRANI